MSPEQSVPDELAPEAPSSKIESNVWRLGPGGTMLSAVVERHAAGLAEYDDNSIYFYASLEGSSMVLSTAETMERVYKGLAAVGLTERQIIDAVNSMQNEGVVFRERAV